MVRPTLSSNSDIDGSTDCSTIVTKQLLQRVYESVVEKSTVAVPGSSQGEQHWDPDHHLFFINAFDMPRWHYSQERKVFERLVHL
jgi:DNA polymerase epsilon subunit 2